MKKYFKAQLDRSTPYTEEQFVRGRDILIQSWKDGKTTRECAEDQIDILKAKIGQRTVFALVYPATDAPQSHSANVISINESEIKKFLRDKVHVGNVNGTIPHFQLPPSSLNRSIKVPTHHKTIITKKENHHD